MKIFLDFLDKRTKFLSTELSNFETFEITKENIEQAQSGDFVVFAPNKKWNNEEISALPNNITLFCGKVDNSFQDLLKEKNIKHINVLENEMFALKNAQLTAEGVLALIIENSPVSLFENNILILGGGRISKSLAIIFEKLGLKYHIASFSETSFVEAHYFSKSNYYRYDFLKDIKNFDVIINTRPFEFFDDEQIKLIGNNTLFLETASKNCLDESKAKHFQFLKAPALPQRFCFESAANLLKNIILGEMKW